MTEDFLSRAYADRHDRLTGGIADVFAGVVDTIRVSLDRLNRYEFDAPWQHDRAPPAA